MNKISISLLIAGLAWMLTQTLKAQPGSENQQPDSPDMEQGMPPMQSPQGGGPGMNNRPNMDQRNPMRPPGPPPLERWMEKQKIENPAEYERLKQLQTQDPKAFRHMMLKRLNQERFRMAFKDHPQIYEAFKNLPDNERDEILRKLTQAGPQGGQPMQGQLGQGQPGQGQPGQGQPMQGQPAQGRPEMINPEVKQLTDETMELSRSYHEAPSAEMREKIRGELRAKLEVLFDAREKDRQANVERMEGEMNRLKDALKQREENRDTIIDERLNEMTGSDTLKW